MLYDLSEYNKIAISGTHKVGKTVLLGRLTTEIKQVTHIPEFALELMRITKPKAQLEFELAIFYSHLCMIKSTNKFISDRSLFDVAAYASYMFDTKQIDLDDYQFITELITNELGNVNQYYDVILLYNMYNSYSKKLTKYQSTIHQKLQNLISAYFNNYLVISKGDVLVYNDIQVVI